MKAHKTVDLLWLRDDKGYTVLHSASFKNSESMVKCLLQCARDISLSGQTEKQKNNLITEWINCPSRDEQFTALHMASFRGNYKIVELLIENKANIHAINKDGLTMMHTAAQGDQALMLYFFKNQGLDINQKDYWGSTSLHWACYSKSEIAISYLLAWKGIDICPQDWNGVTPLHLAVKSCEELKSTRPVWFLLIAGAPRNVRDNSKRLPRDYADAISDDSLKRELKSMLNIPSRC